MKRILVIFVAFVAVSFALTATLLAAEQGVLVYEYDNSAMAGQARMDELMARIKKRAEAVCPQQIEVRPSGDHRIEIVVDSLDKEVLQRIQRVLESAGTLEFRILATKSHNRDIFTRLNAKDASTRVLDDERKFIARWVPVAAGTEKDFASPDIITRKASPEAREQLQVLVLKDAYDVTGESLTRAAAGIDRRDRPCVLFQFNEEGGKRFSSLTSEHLPKPDEHFAWQMGIILGGKLYSATIQSTITTNGEITGDFTAEYVKELVAMLNSGPLGLQLKRIRDSDVKNNDGR